MTRENKPSMVFIDEVDAPCGACGEGESEASRSIKTELPVQVDGVGRNYSGVLIPGATNIPWQLDAASRRRFQGSIHTSLPNLRGRIEIFKMSIGTTPYPVLHADPKGLEKMTEGYSGGDIAIAVQDVLRQPVLKFQILEHNKKVRKKKCLICPEEHGLLFESRLLKNTLRGLEKAQQRLITIYKGPRPYMAAHPSKSWEPRPWYVDVEKRWCQSFLQLQGVRWALKK